MAYTDPDKDFGRGEFVLINDPLSMFDQVVKTLLLEIVVI